MDQFSYIDDLINRIRAFKKVRKAFSDEETTLKDCVEQFSKEFGAGLVFLCWHAAEILDR